jgi:hypothetical protein
MPGLTPAKDIHRSNSKLVFDIGAEAENWVMNCVWMMYAKLQTQIDESGRLFFKGK